MFLSVARWVRTEQTNTLGIDVGVQKYSLTRTERVATDSFLEERKKGWK